MKFKLSTQLMLSALFVFSCFAVERKFTYSPQDIGKIANLALYNIDPWDENKELRNSFLKRFSLFCKENNLKTGSMIGKSSSQIKGRRRNIATAEFQFTQPFFPKDTTFSMFYHENLQKITPSKAMKKFVDEMIEKGKSVNQDQTANN